MCGQQHGRAKRKGQCGQHTAGPPVRREQNPSLQRDPSLHNALELKEVADADDLRDRHGEDQQALGDRPKGDPPAVAVSGLAVARLPRLERLEVDLGGVDHRVEALDRVDQVRHVLCPVRKPKEKNAARPSQMGKQRQEGRDR